MRNEKKCIPEVVETTKTFFRYIYFKMVAAAPRARCKTNGVRYDQTRHTGNEAIGWLYERGGVLSASYLNHAAQLGEWMPANHYCSK